MFARWFTLRKCNACCIGYIRGSSAKCAWEQMRVVISQRMQFVWRVLLVAAAFAALVSSKQHLRKVVFASDEAGLVDEAGRQVLVHGVNIIYKGSPWVPVLDRYDPQYSFSEEDVKHIKNLLNLNGIRLGVMWPGVEPVRGVYNDTYIAELKQIVQMCLENDIYVLLDFHQDAFSERFCGQGIPVWAAQPDADNFPMPLEKQPYARDAVSGIPSEADCGKHGWPDYHLTYALSSASQNLWSNKDGLLDAFALFWKKIAHEFKDFPNVLGYNLMNEPWAGDVFKNPSLLVPGVADRLNLQPAYEHIAKAIREEDDVSLLFFEGVTWDNFVLGFDRVPGGPEYSNRSVLSYHYYKPPHVDSYDHAVDLQRKAARNLKCGAFMTEFGIGYRNGESSTSDFEGESNSLSELESQLEIADKNLQSWLGWDYKAYIPKTGEGWCVVKDESGAIDGVHVKLLSRPYASRVAGKVLKMKYNPAGSLFTLQFQYLGASLDLPLVELQVQEADHFPYGMTATVFPRELSIVRETVPGPNHIRLWAHGSSLPKNGDVITIQLKGQDYHPLV